MEACLPYLLKQVEILQPKVIVCLGKVALNNLLGTSHSMGRIRGQLLSFHDIPLMPTYHPSYILHKKDKEEISRAKWEVWEDMQKVLALDPRETPLKISVSLSYNLFEPLTYRVEGDAAALQRRRTGAGAAGKAPGPGLGLDLDSPYGGRLKSIIGVIDDPFYPDAGRHGIRPADRRRLFHLRRQRARPLPAAQPEEPQEAAPGNRRPASASWRNSRPGELERLAAAAPLRFYFKTGRSGRPFAAPAAGDDGDAPPRLLLAPRPRSGIPRSLRPRPWPAAAASSSLVPDNATARYWQAALPGRRHVPFRGQGRGQGEDLAAVPPGKARHRLRRDLGADAAAPPTRGC